MDTERLWEEFLRLLLSETQTYSLHMEFIHSHCLHHITQYIHSSRIYTQLFEYGVFTCVGVAFYFTLPSLLLPFAVFNLPMFYFKNISCQIKRAIDQIGVEH